MKKLLTLFSALAFTSLVYADETHKLLSPDGNVQFIIHLNQQIQCNVVLQQDTLIKDATLQLVVNQETLGAQPKVIRKKRTSIQEQLTPIVPMKFSTVDNQYNQLLLKFKGNYAIEFRAFNDGVAYRFILDKKGTVDIQHETFNFKIPQNPVLHVQRSDRYETPYEETYEHLSFSDWQKDDKLTLLPLLIEGKNNHKVLLCETNLSDYPAMFLKSNHAGQMASTFPQMPTEYSQEDDRTLKIEKRANYIARTSGKRALPWRYMVVTSNDGQLVENTMSYRLTDKNVLEDTSWIQPGLASWEWWNGAVPYGPDVNFEAGCNLDTYKYFIDFASHYHIPYIIMDEGWAKDTYDPYTPNPTVNVHELIRYGKEKNVGIVLWLTWLSVENHFDLFKTFEEWGVKGVKIDFMNRSDQWMVNFYERVAKEAAKHHLFVDFHGAFKPAGLECKYPNVLSYEGVKGMEQMGGCTPDNSLYLPFMRNAVGPMDYTPGSMNSMQPDCYAAERPNAGSVGTRAYQLALFVAFESGLQMMADNPTLYYRNDDCTRFICQVPQTWDETKVLDAKVGEYLILAKRKGDKWYIGALTNNAQKERTFELSLDFLQEGKSYQMTAFSDGVNAFQQAMDYRRKVSTQAKNDRLTLRLARNGGFAAVLE